MSKNTDIKLCIPKDKTCTIVLTDDHRKKFIGDCRKIFDISVSNENTSNKDKSNENTSNKDKSNENTSNKDKSNENTSNKDKSNENTSKEDNKNIMTFCGIDFEFNTDRKTNTRHIGSMQIIFVFDNTKYHDESYTKPIYIIDPSKLNKNDGELFVKYILLSNVIKIFHGSDSLDYPYIFEHLLKNNRKDFVRFIDTSVDTRFLCEIAKRIGSRLGLEYHSNKCSIYNALYNNRVIDDKMFDTLSKIGNNINYNEYWRLDKLSNNQMIYSAYDVVYLYDLLENISRQIDVCKNQNHDQYEDQYENQDQQITTYLPRELECLDLLSIINRVYRFHMLNRLEIIDVSAKFNSVFELNKLSKDNIIQIDQQIMETPITQAIFTKPDNKLEHVLITFEDILVIDVTRKNLLKCLRPYQHIANVCAHNKTKTSENDIDKLNKLDGLFSGSELFQMFRGRQYIKKLIDLIRDKINYDKKKVECRS
jgi:hypothetical protein